MGFYRERVFPRIMNKVCGTGETHKIRARVCAGLSGEVAEIGFGTGHNIQHYPASVTRVLAVEPLATAVAIAQPRIVQSHVPIEVVGLDGQRLPFDDASIDHVLSTWTLCSIPDAVAALREVARVLRPGGQLHFAEHGAAPDANVRKWQDRFNPLQNRMGAGCNLNRDIPALIEQAGLRIEKLDTYYAPGDPKLAGWTFEGLATPA